MDATRFARQLHEALDLLAAGVEIHPGDIDDLGQITSYADGGYLTDDPGFVVTGADGSQIQVTVLQARLGRPAPAWRAATPNPDLDTGTGDRAGPNPGAESPSQ